MRKPDLANLIRLNWPQLLTLAAVLIAWGKMSGRMDALAETQSIMLNAMMRGYGATFPAASRTASPPAAIRHRIDLEGQPGRDSQHDKNLSRDDATGRGRLVRLAVPAPRPRNSTDSRLSDGGGPGGVHAASRPQRPP